MPTIRDPPQANNSSNVTVMSKGASDVATRHVVLSTPDTETVTSAVTEPPCSTSPLAGSTLVISALAATANRITRKRTAAAATNRPRDLTNPVFEDCLITVLVIERCHLILEVTPVSDQPIQPNLTYSTLKLSADPTWECRSRWAETQEHVQGSRNLLISPISKRWQHQPVRSIVSPEQNQT